MSKRIYQSGMAVTTKWLNASQYLGPSNPGVVFVANPINDYEYPLLKASSFDLPNIFGYFVGTTSDQTINGEKTFLISPKVPTATNSSGTQVVNVDRLNSDIASNNAATSANLSSLSNFIAANYVGLAGTQTISGNKTFSNLNVPLDPTNGLSPICLTYLNNNAVRLSEDQTVIGTKTFTASPQVPNPDSGGDAVNYQTLLNAIGGITNPNVSSNCIKIGNIQVIFGDLPIVGDWSTGGTLNASAPFTLSAPNMSPYTGPPRIAGSIDRLVFCNITTTSTAINFSGDNTSNTNNIAPNGVYRWIAIGYI